MSIAITGATGQLGRIVVEKAKSRGDIIALARNTAKAAELGVEVRPFDYSRAETLAPALQGVEVLVLISGNEMGQRTAQHLNVIRAATESGVRRIVYTSVLRADQSTLWVAAEHLPTESALLASELETTILRNGWYTENYTASVPGALAGGALLGAADDGKIASASREDYAEAIIAVLGEGHENQVYELAGDTAYTLSDLAAEISKQTGREIPYKNLTVEGYAAALVGFGLPEPMAQLYAGFDGSAAKGDLFDDGKVLSTLIGHETTPLSVSVAAAIASVS